VFKILFQFLLNRAVYCALWENTVLVRFAGRYAGEYLDAVFNRWNLVDVKIVLLDGIDDFFAEHQVFLIGMRYHYALFSRKALDFAHFIKPLDLVVDAADSLNYDFDSKRNGFRSQGNRPKSDFFGDILYLFSSISSF